MGSGSRKVQAIHASDRGIRKRASRADAFFQLYTVFGAWQSFIFVYFMVVEMADSTWLVPISTVMYHIP